MLDGLRVCTPGILRSRASLYPRISSFSRRQTIQYPTFLLRATPFISALQSALHSKIHSSIPGKADHELNSGRWSRPRPVEMPSRDFLTSAAYRLAANPSGVLFSRLNQTLRYSCLVSLRPLVWHVEVRERPSQCINVDLIQPQPVRDTQLHDLHMELSQFRSCSTKLC